MKKEVSAARAFVMKVADLADEYGVCTIVSATKDDDIAVTVVGSGSINDVKGLLHHATEALFDIIHEHACESLMDEIAKDLTHARKETINRSGGKRATSH